MRSSCTECCCSDNLDKIFKWPLFLATIEVIINLARGVLVGSSVRKPDGDGLKSKRREGRVSVSVREERTFAGQGFGLVKTAFLKIGRTCT